MIDNYLLMQILAPQAMLLPAGDFDTPSFFVKWVTQTTF